LRIWGRLLLLVVIDTVQSVFYFIVVLSLAFVFVLEYA
jgi:hypothetical protein